VVLGAVLGGTAQSTEFLILGRVIQGACAWWSDYIVALGVWRRWRLSRWCSGNGG
jgi:hypothetical protein